MRFQLLGRVGLTVDGVPVDLGTNKQRCVLAALLWSPGEPVAVDTLIERVWGDAPPDQARNALYAYLARLRTAFRRSGAAVEVTRSPQGYLLRVDPESIDLYRYQSLVRQARAAGTDAARAATLVVALDLWHDEPLAGLPGEWARRARHGLEQRHVEVLVEWSGAELATGRHAEVIDRLLAAADRHPYAEPLVEQLMLAFCRAGRGQEALGRYRDLATRLADDLGLDPGPRLRALETRILRGDPALADGPPALPVPRHLPPDIPHFTGRDAELSLAGQWARESPARMTVVCGGGGVGKTALAVHFAHRIADRYPDGQLYVDLHGYGPQEPLAPEVVLDGFLRALGVAGAAVPRRLVERTALLRSLLADRKLLVLLDNAGGADQVRPLLPASAGCHVVITSRDGLAGLVARDGARRLTLDVLSEEPARELLATLLGRERVAGDAAAADRLIELCDGLPLALCVLAERAARRPHSPLSELTAELSDECARLDLLDGGDAGSAIRAVLSYSYRALSTAQARLFRLLGGQPASALGTDAVASLAGISRPEAGRLLDDLAGLHLIQQQAGGRYQLHDLTRAYAAEQAEPQRYAAVTRLLDFYLCAASAATDHIAPQRWSRAAIELPGPATVHFGGRDEAMGWLAAERLALVALIRHAADHGWPEHAWQLPCTLSEALRIGAWYDDWIASHEVALTAARQVGNTVAEAQILVSLGAAHGTTGRFTEALELMRQALPILAAADDQTGHARVLAHLGVTCVSTGRYRSAREYLARGLALATGDQQGRARLLNALGLLAMYQGDYAESSARLNESLRLRRELGTRDSEAYVLSCLAELSRCRGDEAASVELARQAVALTAGTPQSYAHISALNSLGVGHRLSGDHDAAEELHRRALELAADTNGLGLQAGIHYELGELFRATGDHAAARDHYRRALAIAGETDQRRDLARAHWGLGKSLRAGGDVAAAAEQLELASAIFAELGAPEAAQLACRE